MFARQIRLAVVGMMAGSIAAGQSVKIAIAEARLHIYDDGPVVRESESMGPGDGLWVTARFSGYSVKTDEDKDKRYIHITYRFEAVDPEGVPEIGRAHV